ncbi:MAG: helix-turn-helix domain-containing protein [Bryobacteraceae bacterium]
MSNLKHRTGSDNVFADLGIPEAPDYLVKADLARKIVETIRTQKLTQSRAAVLLGIDQPKVSALMRGLLTGFSIDRLVRFIGLLGVEVEILTHHARPSSSELPQRLAGERTEYMAFAAGANSATEYSLFSAEKEDWRFLAPLMLPGCTVNRSLTYTRGVE